MPTIKTAVLAIVIASLVGTGCASRPQPAPAASAAGMTLIESKGKTFTMGFVEPVKAWAIYRPAHPVTFSYNFLLGSNLVTQGEFEKVMGYNPAKHQGDPRLPVECVSWCEAALYCNALSARHGLEPAYTFTSPTNPATFKCNLKSHGYRLPTNAELEYATRAGTTTLHFYGGTNETDMAKAAEFSWYKENSNNQTQPVGTRAPNPFGLYDMVGNLFAWANDWEGEYPDHAVTDPPGPPTGTMKIAKGGSFRDDALNHQRTAYHYRWPPQAKHWEVGFRVARTAE